MPTNTRAIFHFSSADGGQWTEDYWTAASGVGAQPLLGGITIGLRRALLATTCILREVEFRDTTGIRSAFHQSIKLAGLRDGGAGGPAPSDMAIVFTLGTIGVGAPTRKLWLRGVVSNDYLVADNGGFTLLQGLQTRMNAWITDIALLGWGVRRLHPQPLRPPNVTLLSTIDGATSPGQSIVTTVGPHGLIAGDEAIIYRTSTKDLPSLRGHWIVSAPTTATTFAIPYRTPRDAGPIPTQGFVRKAVYDPINVFNPLAVAPLHIDHHDTRDAFFGSRGARRAKRERQSP